MQMMLEIQRVELEDLSEETVSSLTGQDKQETHEQLLKTYSSRSYSVLSIGLKHLYF